MMRKRAKSTLSKYRRRLMLTSPPPTEVQTQPTKLMKIITNLKKIATGKNIQGPPNEEASLWCTPSPGIFTRDS